MFRRYSVVVFFDANSYLALRLTPTCICAMKENAADYSTPVRRHFQECPKSKLLPLILSKSKCQAGYYIEVEQFSFLLV